jgi:phosphohistidine swiveling domain-containing protein
VTQRPGLFGTKADTLANLEGRLTSARVLPRFVFTFAEWSDDRQRVLAQFQRLGWSSQPVVVRSSAVGEDGAVESMAGKFTSVLNVQGHDAFLNAVAAVFGSYTKTCSDDQILVQPMLQKVDACGVAFTRDPNTGSAYYVVNYDDRSSLTTTVTSGAGDQLKTYYLYAKGQPRDIPHPLVPVIALLRELDELVDGVPLDVEFALLNGEALLLQARPLTACRAPEVEDAQVEAALDQIAHKFEELGRPHPFLFGKRALFGIMPDWNPAEIIGVRPRPLALSLYRELVTDSIWAYQRNNYGYRNLRSFPLLIDFHGLPYIDVRVSFNSFIPDSLDPDFAERLVNYYLDSLAAEPSKHDKVEFEIIFSCYTLDLPERLSRLNASGFTQGDCVNLAEALRTLTNRIIGGVDSLWRRDIQKIDQLELRYQTLVQSDLGIVEKIYWLLEDCKRYGTLPFAGLARAGFIAAQLLDSMVSVGILGPEERTAFMRSLNTVGSKMTEDFLALPADDFLNRYGHLRPGTYDLLSPRYDVAPERYFDFTAEREPPEPREPFQLTLEQLRKTQDLLRTHRLEHDILGFFDFIRSAIEGREHAKFVFTRSLSQALELFRQLGAEHGVSVEECSLCSIDIVNRLYSSSADIAGEFQKSLAAGRERYALTQQLMLPPLLESVSDVFSFHQLADRPNFVTQLRAVAPAQALKDGAMPEGGLPLAGSILLIPSADPGYDWIFSRRIAGFITMFGGVNSHMAIRAAELGIPAVIGAGAKLFNVWSKAQVLEIDCAAQQVRVVR